MYSKSLNRSADCQAIAMETGNHLNGASPKSQKSRGNFLMIFLFAAVLCGCLGCKKDEIQVNNEEPDVLSTEAVIFLDNLDTEEIDLNEIILPDGENLLDFMFEYAPDFFDSYPFPIEGEKFQLKSKRSATETEKLKNTLIGAIQLWARGLAHDPNHTKMLNDGKEPKQLYGLGYSYGSRQYDKRQAPPSTDATCKEAIYGLDCSGLVLVAAWGANLSLANGNANSLRDKTTWEKALKAKGNGYEKILVKTYTSKEIKVSELEAGDVMYFLNGSTATHIGIVSNQKGALKLFQSNGTPNPLKDKEGKILTDCSHNYSEKRGPRAISLTEPMTWKVNGKNCFTDWGVLRLVVEVLPDISISNITSNSATATVTFDAKKMKNVNRDKGTPMTVNYRVRTPGGIWFDGDSSAKFEESKNTYTFNVTDLKSKTNYEIYAEIRFVKDGKNYYVEGDKTKTKFTTLSESAISISISNIKTSSATANVTFNPSTIGLQPSENIILVGVCYSEYSTPTVTSGMTNYANYNSSTSYTFNLSGLSPKTKYFARGFVKTKNSETNTENWIYGNVTDFTTEEEEEEQDNGLAGTKWSCYAYGFNPDDNCYLQGASGYMLFTATNADFYNGNGTGGYELTLSGTYIYAGTKLDINFGDVTFNGNVIGTQLQGKGQHILSATEIHKFSWNGTKQQ